MNVKRIFRWFLRRWSDSNVGASYLAWLEPPVAVLAGIDIARGNLVGLAYYISLRFVRAVVGYFDLHKFGATAYMTSYLNKNTNMHLNRIEEKVDLILATLGGENNELPRVRDATGGSLKLRLGNKKIYKKPDSVCLPEGEKTGPGGP